MKMREQFERCDLSEKIGMILLAIFVSCVLIFSFSTKEFKGYYLSGNSGAVLYSISANWENKADEVIFETNSIEDLSAFWIDLEPKVEVE